MKEKVLYLDQFASSNLVCSNEDIWLKLKSQIEDCVTSGKLICPIPHDHFFETSQADIKKRDEIDNYFKKLSGGLLFKPTAFTNSQLIISYLRGNNITRDTYLAVNQIGDKFYDKTDFSDYSKRKAEFDKMIYEGVSSANILRKVNHNQKVEPMSKSMLHNTVLAMVTNQFIERLLVLKKDGQLMIRGDKFSFIEIPNWIDQTIFRLVNVHKMKPKENDKLIKIIRKNGFSFFPPLDIRFSLTAIMCVESKKEKPNDHVDVERIASGLPISDFFLIDKQRKFEIQELNLDSKYNTTVFSGKKEDIVQLTNELKK